MHHQGLQPLFFKHPTVTLLMIAGTQVVISALSNSIDDYHMDTL